jgi:ceramide glucosyltransferase
MLWRRADLEASGGIEALGKEVAEDAAATKIVRGAELKVRLVDRPLAQPLGRRSASEVWNRQLRWARLRRASFFIYFLPEILSGGVLPMICGAILAYALGWPVLLFILAFALFWYGSEITIAAQRGDKERRQHHIADQCSRRQAAGMSRRDFIWRGNAMQVERMRPIRMAAPLRPRIQELAAVSRKRLQALRARPS